MRRAIVISRYFPPALTVSGKRAYHFSKYLPEFGWSATVLTSPIQNSDCDDSISVPTTIDVVPSLYPKFWPQSALKFSLNQEPIIDCRSRKMLGRIVDFPTGRDSLLIPFSVSELIKLQRQVRADLILATGGPPSAWLTGHVGARFLKVPLVLDFRDPWTMNYLNRSKPVWSQWVEHQTEKIILAGATKVIFSSQTTRAEYQSQYPEWQSKFYTVYTGFDASFNPPVKRSKNRFSVVHFGNCFGSRRLEVLLRALHFLRDTTGLSVDDVRLTNLGRVNQEDLSLCEALSLNGNVEVKPAMRYEQGLEELASADILLLLGYANETGFVPAKLFDYLLMKKPILCISNCPELNDIVTKTGSGYCFAPDDVRGVANLLYQSISRTHASMIEPHETRLEFDVRTSCAQLASILDSALH